MRPFDCACSNVLQLPDSNQSDVKCPQCGRVYSATGRFLWREQPGNDLPGSTSFMAEPPPFPAEADRRSPDQDAAIEQAFVEGKLPEEDRRAPEPVAAAATAETPAAEPPASKPARGDKRKS